MPAGVVFGEIIIQTLAGRGYVEDQPRMLLENPVMNAFWHDRRARVERIEVPAYVVASYTNPAHTVGTFDAWRHLGSAQKWLRIHNTQEWVDYYTPAHVEDLRRFFDRYAKGVANDWESTPKVRMAVLNPGGTDIVGRVETAYPPARAVTRKLFVQADGLAPSPAPAAGTAAHAAESGKTVWLQFIPCRIGGYTIIHPAATGQFAFAYPAPLVRSPTRTIHQSFTRIGGLEHIVCQHTGQLQRRDIHTHTIININVPGAF